MGNNPTDLKASGLKATLPRLKILDIFQNSDVRHLTLNQPPSPRAYDLFGEHGSRTMFVVARARGGSDDPANLVTACVDCNLGKGATDGRGLDALANDICAIENRLMAIIADAHARGPALICAGQARRVRRIFERLGTGRGTWVGLRPGRTDRFVEGG